MRKQARYIARIGAVVAVLLSFAVVHAATKGQDTGLYTYSDFEAKYSEPCPPGEVLLKLGEHTLQVRHDSKHRPIVTLEDGSRFLLGDAKAPDGCEAAVIDNVKAVQTIEWSIGARTAEDIRSSGRKKLENFNKAKAENGSTLLADGVEKVSKKGSLYYLLPLDKAPTANNVPAVVVCSRIEADTANCIAGYAHPSGLGLGYTFYRDDYPEGKYLTVDGERRNVLEDMLAKGRVATKEAK